jgi:pimeloyl-ACP methyl ester carboxylesterase
MQRREFITVLGGAAVAWPLSLHAQQGARKRRIGILMGYAESDPETKLRIAAFRAGLAKRGWSEGHNIQIDYRFSAATESQQTALAKELLALHPEVVLAHTTTVVAAVQRESQETLSLPVAITVFPGDTYRPPETWARRAYRNLIYFHEVDKGGHFAAWEQPELFSAELRAAFRSLRKSI